MAENRSTGNRSMAPMKNIHSVPLLACSDEKRSNDRKAFCTIYLSLITAASIAVSVQAMDESTDGLTAIVHDMMLGTLYATSSVIVFSMIIYFRVMKKHTFEAAHKSTGPVPFIVSYSSRGESVNLYLRMGLAIFALMSVGQNSIQLVQLFNSPGRLWPEVYKNIFELTFFIFQTLFILIYHRIVILHNNEIFGACLVHVLSANLCMWADVMVEKVRSTLKLDEKNMSYIGIITNYTKENHGRQSKDLSFYLLPAVSEFCLLSAALIYEITVHIGEPSYIELENDKEEEREEELGQENSENVPKKKRLKRFRSFLTKIKSGYWSPLVIVLVISLLVIVTVTAPKGSDPTLKFTPWKCAVLFTEEMVLNFLGIFVTFAAFLKLRHLKFTVALRQCIIDEFLLYIAFFFTANYQVATIALTSYYKRSYAKTTIEQDLLMGRLALNVLELIQVILQTYLIQDCFRRCSEEEFQQRMKPGRQMIAILLGINLGGWVVNSFQLKEADILYNMTSTTPYGWVLIAITMPVYLFYRYHCTVCLSQAFTMLYEDETKRFEQLWRQNPIYLANLLSHTNLTYCQNCHLHANDANGTAGITAYGHISPSHLGDMMNRQFSIQSMQMEGGMVPRRTSFFHPQEIPNSASLHDFNSNQHCKISVPCITQVKKHTSGGLLKRLSLINLHHHNGKQPDKIQNSESFEGPNYFLSGHGGALMIATENSVQQSPLNIPSKVVEHSTQTAIYTHDNKRGISMVNRRHSFHGKVPKSCTLSARNNEIPSIKVDEMIGDGMKRRQTLVNLETAKYRFLAAEMAHKRVMDRTNMPTESVKKQQKRFSPTNGASGVLAKWSQHKHGKNASSSPSPTPVSSTQPVFVPVNEAVLRRSAPVPPVELTCSCSPENVDSTVSIGLEPSKVVPLLISRQDMRKDVLLTSVPEEPNDGRLSRMSSCDSKTPPHEDAFPNISQISSHQVSPVQMKESENENVTPSSLSEVFLDAVLSQEKDA